MPNETKRRFEREIRFLQARLSPEGYLGLHLTLGMLLIIATCWSFSEIAEDFGRHSWLAAMDASAADAFHQLVRPGLTKVVRCLTFLGSVGFVTALSLLVASVLAARKALYALLTFALTMLGGSLLNIFLKHLFHRQRPILENPLVTLSSYGFPSGHTMGSTLLWGCVAIFVAGQMRSATARALPFCLAAMWVCVVGATRIYLGAHYFTDVIGAIMAGIAWLTFCWTAVETLRRWRARHNNGTRRGRA